MNPLFWTGTEFLFLYAALCLVAIGIAFLVRRLGDRSHGEHVELGDPYAIAYLRGGAHEASRVAAFSLIDRGLLERSDTGLRRTIPAEPPADAHPLDRSILDTFSEEYPVRHLFSTSIVDGCAPLREDLVRLGLLTGDDYERRRRLVVRTLLTGLIGIAALKGTIALAGGHSNVALLIILCVVTSIGVRRIAALKRTALGEETLARLQLDLREDRQLHAETDLARQAVQGSASTTLIAATFGLSMLPGVVYPWIDSTFPQATGPEGAGGGGCGGACGSGCGGGCGGCGGGCGG